MLREIFHTKQSGFSLVEVILSVAVFMLFITAVIGSWLYGLEATALAGNRMRAAMLAEEGIEAVRNMRDDDFSNLTNGTHGLSSSGGTWAFSGSSDETGIFTREVIVSSSGLDEKEVEVNITWQQNEKRSGSLSMVTHFTKWQERVAGPPEGGGGGGPGGGNATTTCNSYAQGQGYTTGTCRQNQNKCSQNGEDYLSGGDQYCVESPALKACCAL